VVRAVVAGGLLASAAALEAPPPPAGAPRLRAPALALGPLREAVLLVAQLAGALPVDVMAGAADPANQALPQQALHACLLPTAAAYPPLARHAPSSLPARPPVAACQSGPAVNMCFQSDAAEHITRQGRTTMTAGMRSVPCRSSPDGEHAGGRA